MKRRVFYFVILAGSVCGLIACSARREGTGVATPTVAPASTSGASGASGASATGQPSAQPSAAADTAGPATKAGWWIRLNPTLTTAQVITFQIGTDKLNREEWRVWRAGEPAEFDVPSNYLQAPRLYVRGNVTPIGRMADLCLMYKDRGVEHMGFNDDESETKSRFQVDPKCR